MIDRTRWARERLETMRLTLIPARDEFSADLITLLNLATSREDDLCELLETAMRELLNVDSSMSDRTLLAKQIADAIGHPWPPPPNSDDEEDGS